MIRFTLALLLTLGIALPAGAQQMHLGAHFQEHEELRKIVDLRCTVCHTRERIEQAMEENRNMADIQRRMVERGAHLTEGDHKVLSHFWGEPLKERTAPASR